MSRISRSTFKTVPDWPVYQRELRSFKEDNLGIDWEDIKKCTTGHFACPNCNHPFFQMDKENGFFRIGCDKCSWENKLRLAASDDVIGQVRCPDCRSKRWAMIKYMNLFSIGCKGCAFEINLQVPTESKLLWTPN